MNRRRHANTLPLLSLARWIVVAAFICLAGLVYVNCKNELHRSGTRDQKARAGNRPPPERLRRIAGQDRHALLAHGTRAETSERLHQTAAHHGRSHCPSWQSGQLRIHGLGLAGCGQHQNPVITGAIQQRALCATILMAGCFTVFSFRLVHLQVTMHDWYTAKAAGQNVHKEPIYARRGSITDIGGEPLAQNEPVKTVIADGSLIKDPAALAELLAKPLDMPVDKLREKLSRTVFSQRENKHVPLRYIVLKKEVPEENAAEIARRVASVRITPTNKDGLVLTTAAIRFDQDSVRTYPNGSMLCHVVGFINDGGLGMDGVERSMNQYLARPRWLSLRRAGSHGEGTRALSWPGRSAARWPPSPPYDRHGAPADRRKRDRRRDETVPPEEGGDHPDEPEDG